MLFDREVREIEPEVSRSRLPLLSTGSALAWSCAAARGSSMQAAADQAMGSEAADEQCSWSV